MAEKFSFLSHTADIGLEVRGSTRAELFENAAEGLLSYLFPDAGDDVTLRRTLTVTGIDDESLLVNWLTELLYLFATKKFVFTSFHVRDLRGGRLVADVGGRLLRAGEHPLREIKAVTYHGLFVTPDGEGYTARIIFDV